ncbi:MAG: glycosyltransferase [Chthoniobacterales bacterium]
MKPQLAWFSPVVPQPTDVANYTERLRPHLDAHFEIRYFTETESGFLDIVQGRKYDCDPGQVPWEIFRELNRVDVAVYHVGNNPRFHLNTLFLSRRKTGLVVLHDRKLHHFVDAVYKHRLGDRDAYVGLMRKYYGPLGAEAALAAWEAAIPIDFMADQFPLTQFAIENALGVIVHTNDSLAKIRALTSVPVFRLPLAFPSNRPAAVEQRKSSQNGRVRLVMFGFLGPNRRVIEFLRALANLEQRDRFMLDFAGEIAHLDEVKSAVATLNLEDQVTIRGYVEEAALDDLLARADLAINLRYPSMGEASGTQLRIWSNALPSLVTCTEGYAELSEEVVCFVRPEQEEADIQRHLLHFIADPAHFRQMGIKGRRLLEREHSPATYVDRLHQITRLVDLMRLRRTKCDLADKVGSTLRAVDSTDTRTKFYAQAIGGLFEDGVAGSSFAA